MENETPTEAPTENPTFHQETTENPTTYEVTSEHPTTHEVTTEQPSTHEVTTEHPTTHEVTTEHPTTHEGTTVQPTTVRPPYHSTFVNKDCNFTACEAPNCTCLMDLPPKGLNPDQIPQFVLITFDGAVTITNFPYYQKLFHLTNPNGCPIHATYFVSHVDTNYKLVHELFRHGNEIGVHSIRLVSKIMFEPSSNQRINVVNQRTIIKITGKILTTKAGKPNLVVNEESFLNMQIFLLKKLLVHVHQIFKQQEMSHLL